jgi:hypothetical protein
LAGDGIFLSTGVKFSLVDWLLLIDNRQGIWVLSRYEQKSGLSRGQISSEVFPHLSYQFCTVQILLALRIHFYMELNSTLLSTANQRLYLRSANEVP